MSAGSTVGVVLTLIALSGVGALLGGALLLLQARRVARVPHLAQAFAAGVLLAAVAVDLLPAAWARAREAGAPGVTALVLLVLVGFVLYGLLELLCRSAPTGAREQDEQDGRALVPLLVVGDSVHNLVDGAAIAAAFLADPALGVLTAVAVAAHELPQEVADAGVLLSLGLPARKVLLLNGLSALAAVAGGALVLALGGLVRPLLPALPALLAGCFGYLAWYLLRGLRRAPWLASGGAFATGVALFVALSRAVGALAAP